MAEVTRLRERLVGAVNDTQRARRRFEYAVSQEISQRSAAQGALQAAQMALRKEQQRHAAELDELKKHAATGGGTAAAQVKKDAETDAEGGIDVEGEDEDTVVVVMGSDED